MATPEPTVSTEVTSATTWMTVEVPYVDRYLRVGHVLEFHDVPGLWWLRSMKGRILRVRRCPFWLKALLFIGAGLGLVVSRRC